MDTWISGSNTQSSLQLKNQNFILLKVQHAQNLNHIQTRQTPSTKKEKWLQILTPDQEPFVSDSSWEIKKKLFSSTE